MEQNQSGAPVSHTELKTRIGDWMRFWAPEVKRRIELKNDDSPKFELVVQTYELFRTRPDDSDLAKAVWGQMDICHKILDAAPVGAYMHLAHVGKYIP